jgi:hypothetical protein
MCTITSSSVREMWFLFFWSTGTLARERFSRYYAGHLVTQVWDHQPIR